MSDLLNIFWTLVATLILVGTVLFALYGWFCILVLVISFCQMYPALQIVTASLTWMALLYWQLYK